MIKQTDGRWYYQKYGKPIKFIVDVNSKLLWTVRSFFNKSFGDSLEEFNGILILFELRRHVAGSECTLVCLEHPWLTVLQEAVKQNKSCSCARPMRSIANHERWTLTNRKHKVLMHVLLYHGLPDAGRSAAKSRNCSTDETIFKTMAAFALWKFLAHRYLPCYSFLNKLTESHYDTLRNVLVRESNGSNKRFWVGCSWVLEGEGSHGVMAPWYPWYTQCNIRKPPLLPLLL